MILNSIRLDELLKAGAPSGAARGGKYIKREWTGERWKYTYADEPGKASGAGVAADLDDPLFSHSIESVVDGITDDPEKAYKAALDKALNEVGAEYPLAHPKSGEDLTLTVIDDPKKGKMLRLSGESGKVKDFPSRGSYEMWYTGTANTVTQLDEQGREFLTIRPNVGYVKGGEFQPSNSGQWIVQYAKSFPKDEQEKVGKWRASSRELAEKTANKKLRDRALASGTAFPESEISGDEADIVEEGKNQSKMAKPGSVADRMQSGDIKWRLNPETKKRELDATPEEKEALIADTAVEYWGALASMADKWSRTPLFQDNKETWKARFLGVPEVPSGKPDAVSLSPESPTYQAIERAVNTFDPGHGAGFTAYLVGKGKGGWVNNKMMYFSKNKSGSFGDEAAATPESASRGRGEDGGRAVEEAAAPMVDPGEFDAWSSGVETLLDKWGKDAPNENPTLREAAQTALKEITRMSPGSEQQMASAQWMSEMLQDAGVTKYVQKAFQNAAEKAVASEELKKAAMSVLTKDKGVDPNHAYSHNDGDEYSPQYYYSDPVGNQVRYTNAPTGHPDRSSYFGDAALHPSEPDFASNPEYFSPTGQKLTRAPDVEPEMVEWNQSYNRYDPQNLWIGRWPSPDSGVQQYTYLDGDIRTVPKLKLHLQNATTDIALPAFRMYVNQLYNSEKIKDQMTAVALTLLDQGRMRAMELCTLIPDDVVFEGSIVRLGKRRIYAGGKIKTALEILKTSKIGTEPLFTVPMQQRDGDVDNTMSRRIGPNYLAQILDQRGISLLGLQIYHATITFAAEVQRYIKQNGAPWENAKQAAVLAAALEWGHDFTQEVDTPRVLQLVEAVLIDPVAVEAIQTAAEEEGMNTVLLRVLPPIMIPIPYVSIDTVDRTENELEFSQWLHDHPLHDHRSEQDGNQDSEIS